MSYRQAMRWARRHPKGTRQPIIMSTGSGFWPAKAWLESTYFPYLAACKAAGLDAWDAERFYRRVTMREHVQRTPEGYVAMMRAGTL